MSKIARSASSGGGKKILGPRMKKLKMELANHAASDRERCVNLCSVVDEHIKHRLTAFVTDLAKEVFPPTAENPYVETFGSNDEIALALVRAAVLGLQGKPVYNEALGGKLGGRILPHFTDPRVMLRELGCPVQQDMDGESLIGGESIDAEEEPREESLQPVA